MILPLSEEKHRERREAINAKNRANRERSKARIVEVAQLQRELARQKQINAFLVERNKHICAVNNDLRSQLEECRE